MPSDGGTVGETSPLGRKPADETSDVEQSAADDPAPASLPADYDRPSDKVTPQYSAPAWSRPELGPPPDIEPNDETILIAISRVQPASLADIADIQDRYPHLAVDKILVRLLAADMVAPCYAVAPRGSAGCSTMG